MTRTDSMSVAWLQTLVPFRVTASTVCVLHMYTRHAQQVTAVRRYKKARHKLKCVPKPSSIPQCCMISPHATECMYVIHSLQKAVWLLP